MYYGSHHKVYIHSSSNRSGRNLGHMGYNSHHQHKYRRDFPPKFYVSILVFVFLSLQFNFVKYVIVACELPNDNSLDQRMLLKN